jgi:hypothetical protein
MSINAKQQGKNKASETMGNNKEQEEEQLIWIQPGGLACQNLVGKLARMSRNGRDGCSLKHAARYYVEG